MNEFPTFCEMSRTGISVKTPNLNAGGFGKFIDFMKNRGWVFIEKLYNDYELSTTFSIHNSINHEFFHKEWDRDLGEYQSINLPSLICQLYKEKGFMNEDGQALSLCDCCTYSEECYRGNERRKPNLVNPQWSLIELPWVGKNYSKNQIAFLGINPNEDGGLNELYSLFSAARSELESGKTKVDFGYVYQDGKKYKGTYLWHRIAAYSKVVNGALSIGNEALFEMFDFMKEDNFSPENVASEYDNIAFLNHIKCSPIGDRSKPTNKMWENCGKHILLEELKILRPDWLIVLGSGDNAWALNKNVFAGTPLPSGGKIKHYKTRALGIMTKVVVVPHPAAPAGGANKGYYQSIFDAVQILKKEH